MIVAETETYVKWFAKLRDDQAKNRILSRLARIRNTGALGDWKTIGDGISELRIHCRAGYRIYFTRDGDTIILLLCGGDKDTQQADIARAKEMAGALK